MCLSGLFDQNLKWIIRRLLVLQPLQKI